MEAKQETCRTCQFFCQDLDPESKLYFDTDSGECRLSPPRDHFIWQKTRPYHWCGQWKLKGVQSRAWHKESSHPDTSEAVLLFRKGSFCQEAGIVVGYWNQAFQKWHDGGDQLLERKQISNWMPLPEPPSS